jgi:hypothetical protein
MKQTGQELRAMLSNYIGTEVYYRYPFGKMCYTDGMKAFVTNAGGGAYWLLDILGTDPSIRALVYEKGIAFVTLTVASSNQARLTVVEDEGIAPAYSTSLMYTTCPVGEWKFYITSTEDEDGDSLLVCMLPTEY